MALETVASRKAFGGILTTYSFKSETLGDTTATFNLFVPESEKPVPLLVFLAGLNNDHESGSQKGPILLEEAARHRLAILFPRLDTSPRGAGIDGEDHPGFYIDATHLKWATHYRMKAHILEELPRVIKEASIPIDLTRQSIFGHSMGGHGALNLYLSSVRDGTKHYRSVSAFAPVSNPSAASWGQAMLNRYLTGGVEEGRATYDATELISLISGPVNILVDYGTEDHYVISGQLLPENLALACAGREGVRIRAQPGFDHSFYFVNTFAAEHIAYHAKFLNDV